jgi:hypothetical protein
MSGGTDPDSWWGVFAFASFWFGEVFAVAGGISVADRILQRLHSRHPDAWREYGGPSGVSWTPPSARTRGRLYDWWAVNRAIAAASRSGNPEFAGDADLHALIARRRRLQWGAVLLFAVFIATAVADYWGARI